ncbi:AMP-dependent synthetase/ligase [Streptomyces avicenniae]|uniref:AMP-dependent synthetase/ligase n=1 Tax=Streptomyces avicenniae TaxID=500153 RepID=UPI00069B3CF7|nr:AMP-dependent synthetase/ligase [Streptomyces avicenniae]
MGLGRDLTRARRRAARAPFAEVETVREDGVVREVRSAPLVPVPTSGSAADIPYRNAAEAPEAVVVRRKGPDGRWEPVTAAAFAREVTGVARGLVAAGLEPGGRVALMSATRYEWAVLDLAIWAAGGQGVPVYPTSSADQLDWILRDSGAAFLVAETAGHARTARQVLGGRRLWVIEDGALAELTALGRATPEADVTARRAALTPDTPATVVYTSGTTGRPKGCVLTHANLHAETENLVALLTPVFGEVTGQTPRTLLFLPLAHVLGRTIHLACLSARIETAHWPSLRPEELRAELASFRPTFVVGVPYLFEKIHAMARAQAERMGRAASFDRAERVATAYAAARLRAHAGTGRGPGPGLRLARGLYDLLVYRRVRAALGGRLRYAISGGSPLEERLNLFFLGCGVAVHEGYGLTETTAAATVVPPPVPRPGTVGRPVPGTSVRIADDGEVLLKGALVFGGYRGDDAATAAAFTPGGWLATGDLGTLDDEGYLRITGRKKDLLVTSGGKNVSPTVLEDRLRGRGPVGQCMVVGDRRPYVAALVTLDAGALRHWLTARGRPGDTPVEALCDDADLRAAVQEAVDHANAAVSRAESIRRFTLVPGEFTEENGLLTPSMKIRRGAVAEAYAADIEGLYPAPAR